MKQYAEMEKDNEESSDSSEEEESEEEDEDAMEKEDVDFDEEKLNLASAETQYINAMVAKIILESEKNHPERNSKNVWEMLYGDMETYDATSSEDEKKKVSMCLDVGQGILTRFLFLIRGMIHHPMMMMMTMMMTRKDITLLKKYIRQR